MSIRMNDGWKDGWSMKNLTESTEDVHISTHIPISRELNFDSQEELNSTIVQQCANQLSRAILEKQLYSMKLEKRTDQYGEGIMVMASITVAKPGHKYLNKHREVFSIQDEIFSNEELIEAVRGHFPERFV